MAAKSTLINSTQLLIIKFKVPIAQMMRMILAFTYVLTAQEDGEQRDGEQFL